MREAGAAAARQRPERAGRAAEPPGTNELRADKSRPGKMEGSSEGSGAAREEQEGEKRRRAARSNFDMEFAFGYIGGESIHEETMLPLAPSGRPRCGYKQ